MNYAAAELLQPLSDALSALLTWLDANISTVFYIIALVAVGMFVSRFGTAIIARLLHRTVRQDMFPTKTDRERRLKTLTSISGAVVTFVVWGVIFIMTLNKLGVNTAPLLASAGIVSVAIGFGAQSLVRDFVTGIFIIAENQYRVGDYVEIQNVRGIVRSITMRTTVIQDDDGSVFNIPNGSIIVTGNHTMNNNKVSLELSTSTKTDLQKLCTIINKVGTQQAADKMQKEDIIEPIQFKRIKDIKGGNIILRLSGRVKAGRQIEVKSAYYEALQNELFKNKITLS
jgi:moderate conductance mechanosensitive channel